MVGTFGSFCSKKKLTFSPKRSGLCPPLLGGEFEDLGMSHLTEVSLFAWEPEVTNMI